MAMLSRGGKQACMYPAFGLTCSLSIYLPLFIFTPGCGMSCETDDRDLILNLPALKKRGFLCQPQRFKPASAIEVGQLLSVRLRTFRPTRSGSGDAEALGQ